MNTRFLLFKIFFIEIIRILNPQQLNVTLNVLIKKNWLQMFDVCFVKDLLLIIEILKDSKDKELWVFEFHITNLMEIDEWLRVLHIIIFVCYHFIKVHYDIPHDEGSDEYWNEATDNCIMGVTLSIEIEVHLVPEEILLSDPVLDWSDNLLNHFLSNYINKLIN